jgi:hypothetical protein
MDEREAERLTQELSGVFARRGMALWAVATMAQLVLGLQDVGAAKEIPVGAFVKPLLFGLGVGAILSTGVGAIVVQFNVRRGLSPAIPFLMIGGSFGAIQGYVLGANLPRFLMWFNYPGVMFRPAQQRALFGAALGTLFCYLLGAACKRPLERKTVRYRMRRL